MTIRFEILDEALCHRPYLEMVRYGRMPAVFRADPLEPRPIDVAREEIPIQRFHTPVGVIAVAFDPREQILYIGQARGAWSALREAERRAREAEVKLHALRRAVGALLPRLSGGAPSGVRRRARKALAVLVGS
jgi:hypothetical protein